MFYLYFVLIIHGLIAFDASFKVLKSDLLSIKQKLINIILIWSIPFIWSFIAKAVVKNAPPKIMTKKLRNKLTTDPKFNTGANYGNAPAGHRNIGNGF